MIFGAEPVGKAAGGLLAHGIRGDGFSFRKGRVLSSDDVALLAAAGWDGHSSFDVHWTQNCANDSILVDTPTHVSEPVSLALMPLGLIGMAAVRRRQKVAKA